MGTLFELLRDFWYWYKLDRGEWRFVVDINNHKELMWWWERTPDATFELENM